MILIIPKNFYVIRHGQTTDNALGMISGAGSDPHLTDLGREQARAAAILFKALPVEPTRIVTSSLRRTHQTAQLVAGHIEFIVDSDLNERHLGDLDGKISEIEQKAMKALPGEETSADHKARVVQAVNRHLDEDELTLFVCHGGTIRRLIEAAEISSDHVVNNAQIYYFSFADGQWNLTEITA